MPGVWRSQPQILVPVRPELRPIAGINPGAVGQTGYGMMGTDGRMLTSGIQLSRVAKPEGMSIDGGSLNGGLTRAVSYTDHPFSFVFMGRTDGAGAAVYSSIATTADKTVRVYANSATIEAQHIGATTNAAAATGNVWTFGTPYVAVAVFASPTDVRVYGKGFVGKSRGQSTTNVGALGTLDKLSFCTYDGSSKVLRHVGQIALAQWFRYAFSDEEADELLENPWAIFQPTRRRLFAPPSAADTALASALAAAASLTSALTTAIRFAATPSALAAVTAALTTAIPLAASTAAAATVTASLTTAIPLATTGSATATLTADLTTGVGLNTAVSASASLTADLTTQIRFAAVPAATATLTADLTTFSTIAAAPSATATLTAALTTAIPLQSTMGAQSMVGADLSTAIPLYASIVAQASITANLTASHFPDELSLEWTYRAIDYSLNYRVSGVAGAYSYHVSGIPGAMTYRSE